MGSKAAAEEVARIKALEARIAAATVWSELPFGLKVEDLQERRYKEAIHFLKHHYLTEEGLYKSVRILDCPESVDEFTYNAMIWMKDKMSLALVKEKKDKLVGLVLCRIQEQESFSRTFSSTKITRTGPYSEVMKFFNVMEKPIDFFSEFDVTKYLKIYVIAVSQRYRHRGVVKELFKSVVSMATRLEIPAVIGHFSTRKLRDVAALCGFKEYREIFYVRYQIDDKIIFQDMGDRNYGCALMARQTTPEEEEDDGQGDGKDKDDSDNDSNKSVDDVYSAETMHRV